MSDDAHDPDAGRRALQCQCGASRKHTDRREAFAAGWGSTWIQDRHGKERRLWHCPDCYVPPAPAQTQSAPPPRASEAFLRLATGRPAQRLRAAELLRRLRAENPGYAWRWLCDLLVHPSSASRLEEWLRIWKEEEPVIAQHSRKSSEHYTPPEICDLAREVLGGVIDLDPASCAQANKLVRARRYYTREDNGLCLPWRGTVFLNPPGDELSLPGQGRVSQAAYWWAHLASRFEARAIPAAVFVIFNLELLRHAQAWPVRQPLDFAVCIPSTRLFYYQPTPDGPTRGEQPTHPSALVYLGPRREQFCALFAPLGYVIQRD